MGVFMKTHEPSIAVIGFGEAGSSLCIGWNRTGVRSYDIKQSDADTRERIINTMQNLGVEPAFDTADAVNETDLIFSTVTADQAFYAASSAAKGLKPGAFFFDLNSCAPKTKQKSAVVIQAAGARYIDVAVMAPITQHLHKTAMLICGEDCDKALPILHVLNMVPKIIDGPVGRASTIKMIRSIMVKGIEALTAECFLAASKAQVVEEVADSLDASQTNMGWKDQAKYNVERMTTHGIRRAAEMREVYKTLNDLGIKPEMTKGTIVRQEKLGQLGISLGGLDSYEARIMAIEAATKSNKDH